MEDHVKTKKPRLSQNGKRTGTAEPCYHSALPIFRKIGLIRCKKHPSDVTVAPGRAYAAWLSAHSLRKEFAVPCVLPRTKRQLSWTHIKRLLVSAQTLFLLICSHYSRVFLLCQVLFSKKSPILSGIFWLFLRIVKRKEMFVRPTKGNEEGVFVAYAHTDRVTEARPRNRQAERKTPVLQEEIHGAYRARKPRCFKRSARVRGREDRENTVVPREQRSAVTGWRAGSFTCHNRILSFSEFSVSGSLQALGRKKRFRNFLENFSGYRPTKKDKTTKPNQKTPNTAKNITTGKAFSTAMR